MDEQRLAELMVRAADGLATPTELHELERCMDARPALRAELDAHRRLKAVTDGWIARLDADRAEDLHQAQAATRWEARLGTGLLLAGLALLVGFGLSEVLTDPDAPLWLRSGLGMAASGALILLFSAIRWRLATSRHDAYKEIVR